MHLGLGSFHRAHQAVYTARAIEQAGGSWGIVGLASSHPGIVEAMRRQDGRYSVLELGLAGPRVSVIAVHAALLVAAADPEAVTARIADPRIRVVTVTVTERGYTFDPRTRQLDTGNRDLAADLAGGPPRTAIGRLAAGLLARFATRAEPIALVSCDNIPANGMLLRNLILEYLDRQTRSVTAEMRDWVARDVAFPSTMVDRIVPRTTDEHRATVARLLGVHDEVVVPAEPYSIWVVEDRFPGGRPAWELAGARMGGEVERFEQLKLGLLNATHSLVAYLGLLAGVPTIAQAVAVSAIRQAAEHLMAVDVTPTLEPPAGIDPSAYGDEVLARFANPHTGHQVRQVASDGATKLPQRVGSACRERLAHGALPAGFALLLAAYLRTMAIDDDNAPAGGPLLVDPERTAIRAAAAAGRPIRQIADEVFVRTGIVPGDVTGREELLDLIAHLYTVLGTGGVDVAVRDAVGAARGGA